MRRNKMSKRSSKAKFSRSASRTMSVNNMSYVKRGGIRF